MNKIILTKDLYDHGITLYNMYICKYEEWYEDYVEEVEDPENRVKMCIYNSIRIEEEIVTDINKMYLHNDIIADPEDIVILINQLKVQCFEHRMYEILEVR